MHKRVCTDKSLHRGVFAQSFRTHKKVYAQRSSYTQKHLDSEVFTPKSLYTETLTHRRVYKEKS